MNTTQATGYLRVIERASGPVFYAHVRTADGRRLQRKLGPAWWRRSRPPEGHLTPQQAEARLAAILRGEDRTVATIAPSGTTFADAAGEWIRYIEHDRRRERSTVAGYRHILDHRLLPAFGRLRLDEIDARAAERWRMALVAEGLSASTINRMRWQAASIVKRAQRIWNVTNNPFDALDRQPHRPSMDFNILQPDEVLMLAARAAHQQDGALFTVAGFSGLRLGELRALRWRDLDFANRLIHVRRSYVHGAFKLPKSGRVRSVPMIDQVIAPLDALSRRPRFTDGDDLVFANPVGDPIDESAMRRRFHHALADAGLKRVRFHDLRHSYCSMAVRAWRLDEVKAYAGHADIATTMGYVHHVPAHDAADRLSAVVSATTMHPTMHRTPDIVRN
jgi:integrase